MISSMIRRLGILKIYDKVYDKRVLGILIGDPVSQNFMENQVLFSKNSVTLLGNQVTIS